MNFLRTHLVLARASNISTVWSNILCAWIIVGGYNNLQLAALLVGASLLYTGGMYLNDYYDREFDSQYRPERPIPSGQISASSVRNIAFTCLGLGLAAIAWNGWLPGDSSYDGFLPTIIAVAIIGFIFAYDITHKTSAAAPVYMAACRAGLFLMVASCFENGIDTYNLIATGTAFTFILGVTYLARSESTDNTIDYPALAMIAAPLVGAFYYRSEFFESQRAAVLALILGWYSISYLRARADGRFIIGKTIGPLLASIPLVDLLVVATLGLATQQHLVTFAIFFAIAYAAQRVIPAS